MRKRRSWRRSWSASGFAQGAAASRRARRLPAPCARPRGADERLRLSYLQMLLCRELPCSDPSMGGDSPSDRRGCASRAMRGGFPRHARRLPAPSYTCFNSSSLENIHTLTLMPFIRVDRANHHFLNAALKNSLRTGTCLPSRRTGLESNIQGRSLRRCSPQVCQRLYLRVRTSKSGMMTLAYHFPILYNDCTHHRIGVRCTPSFPGFIQSYLHVFDVRHQFSNTIGLVCFSRSTEVTGPGVQRRVGCGDSRGRAGDRAVAIESGTTVSGALGLPGDGTWTSRTRRDLARPRVRGARRFVRAGDRYADE